MACITPAFKKEDRLDKTNYRPIGILNVFSKVFERFMLDQLTSYFRNILSEFLSAYRKQYSCQHVLLRVIETWRKYLDENKIVGATLMDLSKAFDCLPHDLLMAKLVAYGLDNKALTLMLSYLSGRKQYVKIRNSFSLLKLILSCISQGSVLGPILFNIFMNHIFFLLGSDLHNFADDNTVTAVAETIQDPINSPEVKTSNAIKRIKDNDMMANPDKFKAIMLTKTYHNTAGIRLKFSGETILSSNEIDLLGIATDTKLSFDSRIAKICRKAAGWGGGHFYSKVTGMLVVFFRV